MPAGFSGTPLAKQLNLRDGQRVWFDGMPESIADEIDEYALDLIPVRDPSRGVDAAHVFVTERSALEAKLAALRQQLRPDGQVWISWPHDSTEISEEVVRTIAVPLGFFDTKACAIDAQWSGLKLVIRKDLR